MTCEDSRLRYASHSAYCAPSNFDSSIIHLQNALQHISSWMTANLLTPISSKTEFLLTGLKNVLAKINNSSLNTSDYVWSLGFIFDDPDHLLHYYVAVIQPVLEYCSCTWHHNITNKLSLHIEATQKVVTSYKNYIWMYSRHVIC